MEKPDSVIESLVFAHLTRRPSSVLAQLSVLWRLGAPAVFGDQGLLPALPSALLDLNMAPASAQRRVAPGWQQRCGVTGVQVWHKSFKVLGGLRAKRVQHLPVHQGKPKKGKKTRVFNKPQQSASAVNYSADQALRHAVTYLPWVNRSRNFQYEGLRFWTSITA